MLAGMLLSAAIWTSSAEAGRIAYVADYDANVVSQLDTETNAFLSTSFSGMTDTYMLQVSPDGKYLWIPRFTPNKVSVVDLTDGQALPDIDVDQNPVGVVFSPDSSMAYVLSYDASTVQVFDTATRQQIGDDIPVGAAPYYESLSPDGSRLYVANFDDDTISVINTADRHSQNPINETSTTSTTASYKLDINRLTFSLTCNGWSEVRASAKSSGKRFFKSASVVSIALPNAPICSPERICTDNVTARVRCQAPCASRRL